MHSSINVLASSDSNKSIKSNTDNLRIDTEDSYNFKTFEIEIPDSRDCFCEFWLLPAEYNDGSFSKFVVYLNGEIVGKITPVNGNWQSAHIDDNKRLNLNEGRNVLAIGTLKPEIPAVESVCLAENYSDAQIDSEAYDSFYEKVSNGFAYDTYDKAGNSESSTFARKGLSIRHFENVLLKYTFFHDFEFDEGEEVVISTSSSQEHDIDIFYLGTKHEPLVHPGFQRSSNMKKLPDDSNIHYRDSIIGGSFEQIRMKARPMYDAASNEEMQGLNWKGISRFDTKTSLNTIHKRLTIPKTGMYMVRLRHRNTGMAGTASLIINDKYKYKNIPISFSKVNCEISADDTEYSTMTICNRPEKDDVILFMHGADADRVVGFNDDADRKMVALHGLSTFDSHICQQYKIKTSGVSVSNYYSSDPESSCEIMASVDESMFDPGPDFEYAPGNRNKGYGDDSLYSSKNTDVVCELRTSGKLEITTDRIINRVIVTDLYGKILKTQDKCISEGGVIYYDLDNMASGIYIISIETSDGCISKKFVVE